MVEALGVTVGSNKDAAEYPRAKRIEVLVQHVVEAVHDRVKAVSEVVAYSDKNIFGNCTLDQRKPTPPKAAR